MSSWKKPALQAAIALGIGALAIGRVGATEEASTLALSNIRTQQTARPNEWIRVTWSVESGSRVRSEVHWGTKPHELVHTGEGAYVAAAGKHAFYNRVQVPDHPCTLYYAVDAKDAAGRHIESQVRAVRVEIPPVPPGALGFTKRPGKAIPDDKAGGVTVAFDVAEHGQLDRVELRVGITHPRRGDLSVTLVSPSGTKVRLHGPSNDTAANLRGCFGDGVPGDLLSAEDLSLLQGEPFHGTWKVIVADAKAGKAGKLDLVALTIYEHVVPTTSPDELLPDLRMSAPDEVSISRENGRKLLEFGTTVANMGPGPFMIRGQWNAQEHAQDAYQQIYKKKYDAQGNFDGFDLVREEKIGEFVFDTDEGHQHFHFKDWASYVLLDESFRPAKGAKDSVKVSFAIMDVSEVDASLEGASLGGTYTASEWVQGISVGWSDTYGAGLEGQSVDVSATPDGVYYLVLEGTKLVAESKTNKANDDAAVKIRIHGDTVTVLEKLTGAQFHARKSGQASSGTTGGAPAQPAPATSGAISFAHAVQPIFTSKCIVCHRTVNPAAPFSLEAGKSWRAIVNVESLEAHALNRVTPRSPQASYLWAKLNGTQAQVGGSGSRMPEGSSMTGADLATIKQWIAEGAPNN